MDKRGEHASDIRAGSGWRTFYGSPLSGSISDVVEHEIKKLRSEGRSFKICIGTDSQKTGNRLLFATALVFTVKGNGGYMFIKKMQDQNRYPLKERLMMEIAYSIGVAFELESLIRSYGVELEIHADINANPRFPSSNSLKDAMGYINGMGYRFVHKPDSFAASSCADIFCH